MVKLLTDLTRAFQVTFPEDESIAGRGELPDPFYCGLTKALGEDLGEVDFVHAIEQAGKKGFLIVNGDRAWLARYEPPGTTDVLFLSSLRHGRYSERVLLDDKGGGEIEAVYKHRHLGRDGALLARIPTPFHQERWGLT